MGTVAEKTFIHLRKIAVTYPEFHCIAISQSEENHTLKWVSDIGSASELDSSSSVTVLADSERDVFGHWGLGTSSWGHVLAPRALWSAFQLARQEGIKVRDTDSGSRWQTGGQFALDSQGIVRWGGAARRADEILDWDDAVRALKSHQPKL